MLGWSWSTSETQFDPFFFLKKETLSFSFSFFFFLGEENMQSWMISFGGKRITVNFPKFSLMTSDILNIHITMVAFE